MCGFALSCWNTQGLPWNRRHLEGSICFSKTRHDGASGPCSHMASFLHDRALVGIYRWYCRLCLPTVVSGSIAGLFIMSIQELCWWVMQHRLRTRRPRASNKGLQPCPLRTEISLLSLNYFYDFMHCRLWDLQSLCNLVLKNVVFKVFYNVFMQSFTMESLCPSFLLRESASLRHSFYS